VGFVWVVIFGGVFFDAGVLFGLCVFWWFSALRGIMVGMVDFVCF